MAALADSTTVFNEIQYHPRSDSDPEWVELHNQMAVDMDLSQWSLDGAVSFTFPEGSIIPAGGYLVVAADPALLSTTAALGPFFGRLDNAGERLELRNNSGRLMDALEYDDNDPWPAAADGSGATLSKRNPGSASAPAENWGASVSLGGSPGQPNVTTGFTPAGLALNELAPIGLAEGFWVELINLGSQPAVTAGCRLAFPGTGLEDMALPDTSLEPGAVLLLDVAAPFGSLDPGALIALISAGGSELIDARRAARLPVARAAEHGQAWRTPLEATPGLPNIFAFHQDVVINEILYRAYPLAAVPAQPAQYETEALVPLRHAWRFDATGSLAGDGWTETDFTDDNWSTAEGPFRGGNAVIPETGGSNVALGRTTYYFRTTFEHPGPQTDQELQLRYFVDDGAVFYLNGEEIHRFNMRAGPVSPSTIAASAIGEIVWNEAISLPADLLEPGTNTLAVEVHQSSFLELDLAFGTEFVLAREISPAVGALPFRESPEEWIELYNRSDAPINLSGWSLTEAVQFNFPTGAVLEPDDYLVVSRDREALLALHPSLGNVFGNWEGRLSNRAERIVLLDAHGNTADEVAYADGKPWPDYADGGGSSLELRDPWADNSRPEAWAASDAAALSQWQTVSYRAVSGQAFGPTRWNELCLGLLTAGEVLIDDIQVIEDPNGARRNLIRNANFGGHIFEPDGTTDHWRFLGTHRLSRVEADPDAPQNPVLRLIASGPSDTKHNHVETTYAENQRLLDGNEYEVSFRARWLGGSNRLNVRSYFNRLARTVALEVPAQTGTPGRQNSRAEPNLGPTFARLRHSPLVPSPAEPVQISVQASDPDGIASIKLHYAVNGGSIFAGGSGTLAMEMEEDGSYAAALPPRAAGSIVEFYLEAADTLDAVSFYPAAGPESPALYQVDDGAQTSLPVHRIRIVMTKKDSDFLLSELNLMSNERLGAAIIYNEQEVFYDAQVRLKGSGAGRARDGISYQSLNIAFPRDQLFRGVHDSIGLDRSGRSPRVRGQDEIYIKHLFNRAGLPCMYDDLVYLAGPRNTFNGTALLLMARYESEFTSTQFEGDDGGTVYNYDITYEPTSTIDGNPESLKRPSPFEHLQTDLTDLGDDPESYRTFLEIRTGRQRDDYEAIMRFCQTMSLPADSLATHISEVMDVDQWMRCAALTSLCGIGDNYLNGGLRHNFRMYAPPQAGRVVALPWDMDFVFNSSASAPLLQSTGNLRRVMDIPEHQRLFYGHVLDLLEMPFNTAYLSPWLQHYGSTVGQNYTAQASYVQQRGDSARSQIQRLIPEIPFEITTQGGQDFTVPLPQVTLRGRGWLDVRSLRLAGQDRDLPVRWTALDSWELTLPLLTGPNLFQIEARDFQDRLLTTKTLTITSTASVPTPARFLRVTEIHYHPAAPSGTETAASSADGDFEFIELRNIGAEALDLTGVAFTAGIRFEFPDGSNLAAGGYAVLAKHRDAFVARYGPLIPVAGVYSGNLSNSGESILLQDSTGSHIQAFAYSDSWEPATDGQGRSLTVRDDTAPPEQWSQASHWKASSRQHGSPGGPDAPPEEGGYTDWAARHFTAEELADPSVSGPHAIPPGFSISNLLRYALVLDSPEDRAHSLPRVLLRNGEPLLRFLRRANSLDLEFTIESSTNLTVWLPLDSGIEVEQSNPDGSEWVTAVPPSGESSRQFLRLRVRLQAPTP